VLKDELGLEVIVRRDDGNGLDEEGGELVRIRRRCRCAGGRDGRGSASVGTGTIGHLIFFSMSTSNRYHSAVVKDVVYPEVKG
jgi:hypothetical protein